MASLGDAEIKCGRSPRLLPGRRRTSRSVSRALDFGHMPTTLKTRGRARSWTPRVVGQLARLHAKVTIAVREPAAFDCERLESCSAQAHGQASNVHSESVGLSPLSSPADGLTTAEAQAQNDGERKLRAAEYISFYKGFR